MRRPRDQRGTALVEFVWLAVLLLLPLLYLVLAVFDVQRTAYAASTGARSASRAFVGAADQESGQRAAEAAVALAFADQGLPDAGFTLTIRCAPDPERCLVPGSVVTAIVEASSVLPLMPTVFGDSPPAVAVAAESRSPYGTFRTGRS